jgi:hypothetical protein
VEVAHKRRIEQTELMLHLLKILRQTFEPEIPKLTNDKPAVADILV